MIIENVLPKHLPGIWKTSFENIDENYFGENISITFNKCLNEMFF